MDFFRKHHRNTLRIFYNSYTKLPEPNARGSNQMHEHPAVLLMAYGRPNSLDEVGEYLREVRGGRLPKPEEDERLRDRYRQVGGQTPLLKITLAQAKALEEKFQSARYDLRVYVGMKHWHPFIDDVVLEIRSDC